MTKIENPVYPLSRKSDFLYQKYGRFFQTLYEWIEYVWYSKIVDFNSSEQIRLVSGISSGILILIHFVRKGWHWVVIGLGGIIALIVLRSLAPIRKRSLFHYVIL